MHKVTAGCFYILIDSVACDLISVRLPSLIVFILWVLCITRQINEEPASALIPHSPFLSSNENMLQQTLSLKTKQLHFWKVKKWKYFPFKSNENSKFSGTKLKLRDNRVYFWQNQMWFYESAALRSMTQNRLFSPGPLEPWNFPS